MASELRARIHPAPRAEAENPASPEILAHKQSESAEQTLLSAPAPALTHPAHRDALDSSVNQQGSSGAIARTHYYPSKELDQRPLPTGEIIPRYPENAAGVEVVVLKIYISARGDVDEIQVLTAGLDERFASNARSAFQTARFVPGMRHGIAVPSVMLIEVVYDPNDNVANWEKSN